MTSLKNTDSVYILYMHVYTYLLVYMKVFGRYPYLVHCIKIFGIMQIFAIHLHLIKILYIFVRNNIYQRIEMNLISKYFEDVLQHFTKI